MNPNFQKYKSKICQALGDDFAEKDRKELLRALDRAFIELQKREQSRMFKEEGIQHLYDFELTLKMKNMYCKMDGDELRIAAVVPDWWFGWKKISKTDYIADIIDGEFHFLVQYIFRASKLNLIAALSLSEEISLEFFQRSGRYTRYSDWKKEEELCLKKFFDKTELTMDEMSEEVQKLAEKINCLDPDINRIIFYYIEAKRLKNEGFWRSAITDIQSVVDAIVDYARKRKAISGEVIWSNVLKTVFETKDIEFERLENLYELRNSFSAHPAHSKWWDFSELYDEEIDNCFSVVEDLLLSVIDYEKENRIIEKEPHSWCEWYENNAYIIFDAIGFHKLPELYSNDDNENN